mmetsp:Transcript_33873/g.79200  ORF Transcript_33873/g.79200 Transcript_33873/m.79200 type:complete len:435 (-) Transcript_33873:102-1406(-)
MDRGVNSAEAVRPKVVHMLQQLQVILKTAADVAQFEDSQAEASLQTIADLQNDLQHTQAAVASMEAELCALKSERSTLTRQLEDVQEESSAMRTKNMKLNTKVQQLNELTRKQRQTIHAHEARIRTYAGRMTSREKRRGNKRPRSSDASLQIVGEANVPSARSSELEGDDDHDDLDCDDLEDDDVDEAGTVPARSEVLAATRMVSRRVNELGPEARKCKQRTMTAPVNFRPERPQKKLRSPAKSIGEQPAAEQALAADKENICATPQHSSKTGESGHSRTVKRAVTWHAASAEAEPSPTATIKVVRPPKAAEAPLVRSATSTNLVGSYSGGVIRACGVDAAARAMLPPAGPPCRCVVRNKEARQALQSFDCEQCRKYYSATEGISRASSSHALGSTEAAGHHAPRGSRHRFAHAPASTPPGFWDLSFPDNSPQT